MNTNLSDRRVGIFLYGLVAAGFVFQASQAAEVVWSPAPEPLVRRVADRVLEDFPKPPEFNWGEGVLMAGMMRAGVVLKEQRYVEFVRAWADYWQQKGITGLLEERGYCGHWGPGLPVLMLFEQTGDRKYLEMARQIVDYIQTKAVRTAEGFPSHVKKEKQVWVDTLFMCCPVYTHLGQAAAEPKWNYEAAKLLDLCAQYSQDNKSGLFWHVYDEATRKHIGPLWARGNGWVALCYGDVLPRLDGESAEFKKVAPQFERLARGLLATQDEKTGLWHTILDRPDSYLETSASAMFLWSLAQAKRVGLIKVDDKVLARTWASLADKVDGQGRVIDVSAGTDARNDLNRYLTKPRGTFTWGTGAFLLTGVKLMGK